VRKGRAQIPNLIRKLAKAHGVRTDESIAQQVGKSVSNIDFYEMDLDANSPPRLIDRIESPEQADKYVKKWNMAMEDAINPNYDDTEFKKQAIDDLIQDPNFADLRDVLEYMKLSHDEEEGEKGDAKAIVKELDSALVISLHEWAQEALENPEYAAARDEIIDFQNKLPYGSTEDSGFLDASKQLDKKLRTIPAAWEELDEINKKEQDDDLVSDEWLEKFERDEVDLDDLLKNKDVDGPFNIPENVDALLIKMKELMAAMGGNREIEDEIQTILDDDPAKAEKGGDDRAVQVFDFKELTNNLKIIRENPAVPENWDPNVDAKTQAMVNQMMADPHLLRKLTALKNRINKSQVKSAKTPSAPDPETLDRSRLASYRERLVAVEKDPEHLAALRRLQVHLLPPFNVSPALKSLNESLKLAYLGASDDVRRVLWRSYMRARTVPTLLQNIPEDAWDMLWYSQAVTWRSNQNRQSHMRILLRDLNSVGREGPPTHPDTLEEQQ
jgi:hypothetical protein